MKTKILSTVAAIAISLGAITAAGNASARHGYGLGGDAYYHKYGVSYYEYAKLCRRLHYNWKVLGNRKAKELFIRWNCFKFYGY
jgi:hypothetical protein